MTSPETELARLKEIIENCTGDCKGEILFGDGTSANPDVMFIGWAPNPRYDGTKNRKVFGNYSITGKRVCELKRSIEKKINSFSSWDTNFIKCSCPKEKHKYAIKKCRDYLLEEIRIIDPKLIVLFGGKTIRSLLGIKNPMSKSHGRTIEWKSPWGKTYHCVLSHYHPSSPCFPAYKDILVNMIIKMLIIMNKIELTHRIEEYMLDTIIESFPNYIKFDHKYLLPLTGRPYETNWRVDTHENLEGIAMSHFGIYKSIRYIKKCMNKIRVGDEYQTFKNIYFHLGLIFDNVENLARNIIIVEDYLGIRCVKNKLKKTKKKLLKKYKEWIDKHYDKAFDNMIKNGKPILYYPQHDYNFLSLIITDKSTRRKYNDLVGSIKDYRNFFIHNPGVDILIDLRTGEEFAIRKEYVDKCKLWSSYGKLFREHPEYFINPRQMVSSDLEKTLITLNQIWRLFLNEMEKVYTHSDFSQIFRGFKREEFS